jgi:Holliday junction resolvase RusA-like endonuclease
VAVSQMCGERVSLTIQLTMPPSVNSIWRTTVRSGKPRTYRAKTYADWMNTAAWTVRAAVGKTSKIKGDVEVRVMLWPRRGDLDNRLKAICDALVQGGAIEDDKQITYIKAEWWPSSDGFTGADVEVIRA